MTKNQIEYAKLLETRRANQANEAIVSQRDARSHAVALQQLGETSQHNRATEAQQQLSLDELARANRAKEAETYRANVARERENTRSNVAREQETARANLANEALTGTKLTETERTNKANEAIRIGEAATKAADVAEKVRSHLATEAETALHNRAMELKSYDTKVNVAPQTTTPIHLSTDRGGQPAGASDIVRSPRNSLSGKRGSSISTTDYKTNKGSGFNGKRQ